MHLWGASHIWCDQTERKRLFVESRESIALMGLAITAGSGKEQQTKRGRVVSQRANGAFSLAEHL